MPAARAHSRPAHPRGQRRGPDGPAAAIGTSARPARRGVRSLCSRSAPRSSLPFTAIPWLIHRLTYRRHNHDNLHVRGYKEEGTTTTPFDMCVLNNIDRFQLALDAIVRVPRLAPQADAARQWYSEAIQRHRLYVSENGDDLPEIKTGAGRELMCHGRSATAATPPSAQARLTSLNFDALTQEGFSFHVVFAGFGS